jgi:anti-sigma factor RsiW
MIDEPSELDLHAYMDDALDAGRRFADETHLSDNPALAARVMGELSQRTALRLLGQDMAPLPAGLLTKATGLYGRSRQIFWRRAATVGGISLMAVTSAFLLISGRPPAYVGMAVASHRVAMMRADMPSQIEAPALDAREILASTRIALPTLPADWRVTDVQIFPAGDSAALLVAVRTAAGQQLSLFALRERSKAPEIPDAVREGAQSVAYWRRGDMSYALTGDTDPVALDRTAESLNQSWS